MADQPSAPRGPLRADASAVDDGQPRRLRVAIGATALALEVAGTGTPTLVLEAGSGLAKDTWDAVWPALAQLSRVVRYDRAGLGASEAAPPGRTFAEAARAAHTLLERAELPPPYILVGHSLGGLLVRLFAAQYPADVAGVVLIDAVHPQQNRRAYDLLPPPRPDEGSELAGMRRTLSATYAAASPTLEADVEQLNWAASEAATQVLGSLGALPLVVLTQGRPLDLPASTSADFAAYVTERYHPMFLELQADLARLSTRSKHIYARRSGHMIHQDEPELVVAAIGDLLAELRAGSLPEPPS